MDFIKKLCSVSSVSGNEYQMSEFIKNHIEPFCNDTQTDSMGNVICRVNQSDGAKVVLEAHIDNIGLVVNDIDENGFVKFSLSGGINPYILPTAEVMIHGKKDIFGVVGFKPPHLQADDINNDVSEKNMYIDCGLDYKAIAQNVKIGDTITILSDFNSLYGGKFTSGALDNRIGCYIVYECIKRLKSKNIDNNLHALFSVQEEVGCRGVKKAIEKIKPDVAIIVDVTFGISPYTDLEHGFEIGEGITIAVGPNTDKILSEKAIEICKNNNIPYKKEVCCDNTGTDAWPIQVSNSGVRCLLISVPIKYMHTTVEVADFKDIENAIDVICLLLEGGCV